MVTSNDFLTALFTFLHMFFFSLSPFCFCEWPHSLLSTHRFPCSLLFLHSLSSQLSCCLLRGSAMVNLTWFTFPDKPGASCEALPSSPNTSVQAPQPKQATAMKSVLAGFGSGVSKPPNRSSPAPAAAQNQAQSANQAPNPASAFSGLVNNISNSAKKQEQGSSSFGGFSFGLPTSLKLILRVDLLGQKCSNPLLMKRDQIFDWTQYLNSTVWAVER